MKRINEELNNILCELYDMEYEQEALEYILERIEQSYGNFENRETKLVIVIIKVYVAVVKKKVIYIADQLDEFLSK